MTEIPYDIDLYLAHEAALLKDEHGGMWGEHPEHSVADWRNEIACDDSRLGYWQWVAARIDSAEEGT